MTEIHGHCDERFEPLRAMLRANQEQGIDEGASLAVTHHGELVVDLWTGSFDWDRTRPWERDTMVRVFSTSKAPMVILIWMLYDRGLLDLHAPLVDYWPEFGRHGKDTITAHQILTHRSGLPGFGRALTFEELASWDRTIAALEDAELWFEPGTQGHYQPHTSGYMLGEILRRLTGTDYDDFFRRELADPLGLDFHYRLDDAGLARMAWVIPSEDPPDSEPVMDEIDMGWWITEEVNGTVMPSTSGIANGRAIAQLGAMVALGGEVEGRRYLSRETIDFARSEQAYLEDAVVGPIRWGLGLGIDHPDFPAPTPDAMHWGGYGGSYVMFDPVAEVSIGFAPAKLRTASRYSPRGEPRFAALADTVRDVFGALR